MPHYYFDIEDGHRLVDRKRRFQATSRSGGVTG